LAHHGNLAVLNTKGIIAEKERNLMVLATLLMLVVVIPVFAMTIFIVWKYRAEKKATYTPDWDHNVVAESIWWGLPCAIIAILAVVTWNSSHQLDPFKPIESNKKPLTIQVVALQWKWLFIYPDQRVASVNYVAFPENTPVTFQITADAPMNSLWIPQLGGQMYAMPGMDSHLNLMASETGSFNGSSANISGAGFAGMKFTAVSQTYSDFNQWIRTLQQGHTPLTLAAYSDLAKPSQDQPASFYSWSESDLYNQVILKYMDPNHHAHEHTDPLPAAVYTVK
jgi:cytochrome o ubiquinol oxidase subunit 2